MPQLSREESWGQSIYFLSCFASGVDLQNQCDGKRPICARCNKLNVVYKYRTTRSVSSVLSSIKGNAHTTTRPSETETAHAILPPTASRIEFELTLLHHSVYPALEFLDIDSIDLDSLFLCSPRGSPHMSPSELDHYAGSSTASGESSTNSIVAAGPPPPLRGIRSRQTSPVAGPAPDRQYCDSKLNRLVIGY